jgi:hypothetical protein
MNISITVVALIAFILVRSIATSARPLRKLLLDENPFA